MKFEEVLPALREGKRVKRKSWDTGAFITSASSGNIAAKSLMADDWEVYEEPKKPRLLAPALFRELGRTMIIVTQELYATEQEAKDDAAGSSSLIFISWPAVANASGCSRWKI